MENPAVLLRRLNPYCARALEGAASLCQTRAHAEIQPEHWMLKLLEQGEGDLHELLRPILRDHFQPALLARFQTVIYRPLAETAMRTIVEMKLAQVSRRLHRHYALNTQIDESLYDALTAACLLPDTGARNVDSLLNQQILPVLSQQLLTHIAAKQKPTSLTLGWNEEEGIVLEFDAVQNARQEVDND